MSTTTRTVTLSGSVAGKSFSGTFRRDGVGETNGTEDLVAGTAGTLTTRTDSDTGAVTLTAGHGLTSGTYDIFWGGATPGMRHGMTGVITSNSLALDVGTGDNLPVATTAVVVCKQVILDFDSDYAALALAVVSQQRRAGVQFQQTDGTPILSLDLGKHGVDGEPFVWASDTYVANPFGAAISKIALSNGSTGGVNTVAVGVLRS